MFGALQQDAYEAFCHINDIIRTLARYEVSKAELKEFYLVMIEKLCLFEHIVPETELACVFLLEIHRDITVKGVCGCISLKDFFHT